MATIQLKTKLPGPKSLKLMQDRVAAIARGPFHSTPLFIQSARGAVLEDVDGNRLIDFAGGIGVANVGHCAPEVVEAVRDQAGKLIHSSFNVMAYESYVRVAERLNRATPGRFAKKTFLANSGAEAVENAIKIARAHTKRQAVICFDHAFHGRTYLAMTLTSKAKPYRYGFAPYMPEVYRTPFPYAYRWPTGPDKVSEECFKQFEELVVSRLGADQVAAVILEPVLGEGGFIPAPKAFLAKLREFCTANGIVLIADEIQTGFGRTGTLFACEQLGLEPDLLTSAKGLGGGMPISAVTGRAEIMDAPIEGGIGGTFGGNPLSCAAALAVLDTFEKGDLLQRSKKLGETVRTRLEAFQAKHAFIGEVRGLGPMQALEIVTDRGAKTPNAELTKKIAKMAWERGLVLMTAGSYSNVIRLLMPLTITEAELDEGFAVLGAVLGEAHGG